MSWSLLIYHADTDSNTPKTDTTLVKLSYYPIEFALEELNRTIEVRTSEGQKVRNIC